MEIGNKLETERLILRRYKPEDLNDLFEYLSDSEVVKYEPYKAMSLDEVKENIEWRMATDEMIAVETKDTHKMIGNIYIAERDCESFELGYVFNKNYWHKGYAKESSECVIKEAFAQGAHRIYAECDVANGPSYKLLEAMGFVREAHFKHNIYFWKDDYGDPIWKDTYVYSLLNED